MHHRLFIACIRIILKSNEQKILQAEYLYRGKGGGQYILDQLTLYL